MLQAMKKTFADVFSKPEREWNQYPPVHEDRFVLAQTPNRDQARGLHAHLLLHSSKWGDALPKVHLAADYKLVKPSPGLSEALLEASNYHHYDMRLGSAHVHFINGGQCQEGGSRDAAAFKEVTVVFMAYKQ